MSQSDSCVSVWNWLRVLHLDQYSDAFWDAGLTTLQQCRNLTPDQLERMGITLPGHQKRILSSLHKTAFVHPGSCNVRQSDTDCDSEEADGGQRSVYSRAPLREKPLPNPAEENPGLKERGKQNEEAVRPIPCERQKPVPKERRTTRISEESSKGQDKPVPAERVVALRQGYDQERDVGEMKRPVPKERTQFHSVPPVGSHTRPIISSLSDSTLPPIPPRSTPNCPPQRFTSTLTPSARTLTPTSPKTDSHMVDTGFIFESSAPIQTHLQTSLQSCTAGQHLSKDGGRKNSPVSPSVSLSSISSVSSPASSAETNQNEGAPPLPPKIGAVAKGPPPLPRRLPTQSPKTRSSVAVDEMQMDQIPQVPPRIRMSQNQNNVQASAHSGSQPPVPAARVSQQTHESTSPSEVGSLEGNSDDYEDPDLFCPSTEEMPPGTERAEERSSMALCVVMMSCWMRKILPVRVVSDGFSKPSSLQASVDPPDSGRLASGVMENDSQHCAVIKMGWLDKNPPQGVPYYQRRWVKLDVDYLRYFNNEKEVYSKGIISTSFITNVACVGDLKFEVVTNNRTFIFRAETEADRNDWVAVLQDCTRGRHRSSTLNPVSPLTPGYQGYLELRGLRSKLYTVVASDKVFLYKNIEDYHIGVGITSIQMNVGNIKVTDRGFDLTTPYRVFSFLTESEQLKDQWVDAMQEAIVEALSNREVAERVWAKSSNSFCADCGADTPEWAAINLCVVVCKQCAGEHRGLGPSISKIRSLKLDRKVWTEELIQLFLLLRNDRSNTFWAANVPPSETLTPSSCSEDRRRFITNKYHQGKYRKYHPLYGNQKELNNALCINVQSSDVLETLSLIFCGADVNCSTGMAKWPSPLSLANAHSQRLQAELLSHNLNTELPRLEVGRAMEAVHYSPPHYVSHNGFLFKTGSMARAVTECKAREEFSRRWCTLNDGVFSYYESDRNSNPNGALKGSEIVCLAVHTPKKHGYEHTFELYSESERLYLFGTDDPDTHKEWVKSLAKTFIPAHAEPLVRLNFERIGRLKCKDGLNLQTSKIGWFALVGSSLFTYLEDSKGEEIHLRKLNELSIQQEVLVLVERGRTLYIEGERKLDFSGWCGAIKTAAGSGGDTLSQQQLTDTDIPVIVHSCIGYITQCGLTSEGIYRKSGVNSRVAALCEAFRQDARSIRLKEGEHQVDDVSNTLKRFFRDIQEGLFTAEAASAWLSTASLQEDSVKISEYKLLLNRLPQVNKATLQALINHLYCVQRFSELNQMNLHNLAIVFGPTLFQTDGKDYKAGRAIEDLIQHYTLIFEVDEQQLKKQLEEITVIIQVREKPNMKFPSSAPGGDIICTVYLEEKKDTAEQHVKVPGSMTAAELTCEILDRRKIRVNDKEYWGCWEVNDKEEMERPLHYQERVLPILHSFGTDSHLVVKKHVTMELLINYLATKMDVTKHGIMKFREERSILGLGRSSGSFHDRYFILNANSLRMYKDVRSNRPERDWPAKNLKVYLGIKKKIRPPNCWGLTVVFETKKQEKPEKQQWYLCCDSESEMREWFATFLSIQYDGDMWPVHGLQQNCVRSVLPDTHHGNVSLIPLRGSENEMRKSVAAFSQDALAVGERTNHRD
ncbi:arf-GAP with Rho-GAP domain, ANK repeat and PH domain-containing protein 1-like [Thalassophryne amazonica]|uniref:arf-GAP with Rho-GAP domain, ANK repeat and PH domain-containing protein 1-like n=1 Tax=Thalassophryne amazonica TaxID=390379 RepID=UPI0014719A73|nr:arf-GAP with Rho-GAP domain, ANK repeat and PH domain-containing protein 1-like [Thalassophryne amazonica]